MSAALLSLLGLLVLVPSFGGGYEFVAMGPPQCFGAALGCASDLVGSAWLLGGLALAALAGVVAGALGLARWAAGSPLGSRGAWNGWRWGIAAVAIGAGAWLAPVDQVDRLVPSHRWAALAGVAVAGVVLAVPVLWVGERHRRRAPRATRVITPPAPRRPGW